MLYWIGVGVLICFGFMLAPLIVGWFGSTIREIRDTAYLNDMASRSKDKVSTASAADAGWCRAGQRTGSAGLVIVCCNVRGVSRSGKCMQ
jgi:hypothetical protein